jgi:hypothetical protein
VATKKLKKEKNGVIQKNVKILEKNHQKITELENFN